MRKSTQESNTVDKGTPCNCLAIIGLGLMGGSLGLACKQSTATCTVRGYARREETRQLALDMGAVDQVFDDPKQAVSGADLVILCAPVLAIPDLARACIPGLSKDAVLSDVGSTKAWLLKEMSDMPATFVGSHPIAGSEETGLDNARADLYTNAVVVLTPPADAADSLARLSGFWQALGARAVVMSADEHDTLIARTSHVPHLLAASLAYHVAADDSDAVKQLCGTGFRDTTRVAAGSPALWHDVVATNADAILRSLDNFADILNSLRGNIANGDHDAVRAFLAEASEKRSSLLE